MSVRDIRSRRMSPHVAQKQHSAIDGRTMRHAGYLVVTAYNRVRMAHQPPGRRPRLGRCEPHRGSQARPSDSGMSPRGSRDIPESPNPAATRWPTSKDLAGSLQ